MKITVCKGCLSVMHAVNTQTGKPVCIACTGILKDSGIPIEIDTPEALTCDCCGKQAPFDPKLAFIDLKHNTFYCGCRGWD